MDIVQDIKDRLSIEDVVSQYVQLKPAGRSFKGLCPFHQEKSPSFIVSPEKGLAYCFGCHKGGDVFAFVQEVEHMEFPEAIKLLAERAGLDMARYSTAVSPVAKDEKTLFYAAHELALKLYQKELWETEDGKKVLEYVRRRGLTDDTIKDFGVGFSPESGNFLHPALMSQSGMTKKILLQSGLCSSKELSGDKIFDRFRMRLMFPIWDAQGKAIAFGGRAVKKDQEPKYLNSPESALYHKSSVLYLLDRAKSHIKQEDHVMLVEGYMDALMCHQAGIQYAVATSGTALTKDHMKILKKYTHNVLFCFDQDNAGFEATVRAYLIALEADMQVKVVTVPEGKDPADSVLVDSEKFVTAIKEAKPFLEFYLERLFQQHPSESLENVQEILRQTLPFIKQIPNSLVRDFYIRELSLRLKMSESQMYDQLKRTELPSSHPAAVRHKQAAQVDAEGVQKKSFSERRMTVGDYMISLLLQFPDKISVISNSFSIEELPTTSQDIYKWLLEHYNTGRSQVSDFLKDVPEGDLRERVIVLSLWGEESYGSYSPELLDKELQNLIVRLRSEGQKERYKKLKYELRQAEVAGDTVRSKELLQHIQKLF